MGCKRSVMSSMGVIQTLLYVIVITILLVSVTPHQDRTQIPLYCEEKFDMATPEHTLQPQIGPGLIPSKFHMSPMLSVLSQRISKRPLRHSIPNPDTWLTLVAWNLMLLQASDLELNPGPRRPKYLCNVYEREVKRGTKALQCDDCNGWTHARCLGIGESTYSELGRSDCLWFCPKCGLPNHSDLINKMFTVPVRNPFDALNSNTSLEENAQLDSTIDSDTPLLEPQSASTPLRHFDNTRSCPLGRQHTRNTLKIVNINCQSVLAHRDRLGVLIDSVRPDIILGTESWLDSTVSTPTELSAYNVERRDRNRHGGGVLIAIKDDIIMSREYDLEIDNCELFWCKVNLAGSRTLHIGSYYRHNVPDNTSLGLLEQSLVVQ